MPRPARAALAAIALVLSLLAALAVPAGAAAEEYVALGDSYSSGTGTRRYVDKPCRRSSAAYPMLVAAGRPGTTLRFVACSGAVVADVERDQLAALTPATALVTLTIGGNDAGFAKVIARCALPSWVAKCAKPVKKARTFITRTLPRRLDGLYREIRRRAPSARVVVLGYPGLFNGIDCGPVTFFGRGEQRQLNGTAALLRDTLRERAAAHGFLFGDVMPAFRGHAVCDDAEWLNGLSRPLRESFHPNATGHAEGYAPIVRALAGWG
ncbi:SGNH/GDSL hydrolase family protein [Patulibacter sp. S7RM1-6]